MGQHSQISSISSFLHQHEKFGVFLPHGAVVARERTELPVLGLDVKLTAQSAAVALDIQFHFFLPSRKTALPVTPPPARAGRGPG